MDYYFRCLEYEWMAWIPEGEERPEEKAARRGEQTPENYF